MSNGGGSWCTGVRVGFAVQNGTSQVYVACAGATVTGIGTGGTVTCSWGSDICVACAVGGLVSLRFSERLALALAVCFYLFTLRLTGG